MTQAMLSATQGSKSALFEMQSVPQTPTPNTNYYVSTQMYMLPPRALGENGGQFNGLYLITLVDERYWWQFNPVSLGVNQNTTWLSLITDIADVIGITINPVTIPTAYSQPETDSQLWSNFESVGFMLDAIAANIGCTVVRNLNGTYDFLTSVQSYSQIVTNRGTIKTVNRTAGGDIFTSGTNLPVGDLSLSRNSVVPASVTVTFPKYVDGNDPVPH